MPIWLLLNPAYSPSQSSLRHQVLAGQVSTQINSIQETAQDQIHAAESITGEEIPGTMEAEIIDGANVFGPVNQDPNAATSDSYTGDSALPSLGVEATMRGSGAGGLGASPIQETPTMDSVFLPDGVIAELFQTHNPLAERARRLIDCVGLQLCHKPYQRNR